MLAQGIGPQPSGIVQLLRFSLLLILGVFFLWFWGSVLLRLVYALRQVPNQFKKGKDSTQDSMDDEGDK